MGSFQELDAAALFQPLAKWSAVVGKTSEIESCIDEAFRIAISGRPGPVYLDLPEDVLTATSHSAMGPARAISNIPALDENEIDAAADLLLRAHRPAMIIGKGVRWSEPYDELKRLADEFEIPFITSPMGRGYLPDDHPQCFNFARGLLQQKADVVLLLGTRLDWTFRFGTQIARDAKLIQIDIHEPEVGVNRAPTIGIVGDVKLALQKILGRLTRKPDARGKRKVLPWFTELEMERKRKRRKLDGLMACAALPMSLHRMFKEIQEFLPREAICVLDGNVSMAAGQQVLSAYLPASRFTAGSNGCMGIGIPFAVGAKIARPDRMVVSVCGDMGFALSAMDMETAVRHRIPIVVVVVNNEGHTGAIMERAFFQGSQERITMFQPDIRYEGIMRAFGGYAEHVERPEDLKPALERAVASRRAACINVKVNPFDTFPTD